MRETRIPLALSEFAALFTQGAYWQSHEVLEAAWRVSRSDFYHGLILLASAYVHRERGNGYGALAQLDKAEPILRRYGPGYLGVDVEQALRMAAELRTQAGRGSMPRGTPVRLDLDPALVRGDEPELNFTA
jgi:hypothetical protein